MSSRHRVLALIGLVLSAGLSAGCSGDDGVSPPATYAVGGSVSGLQTGTLVLQNNGSDEVSLATDGIFRFPTGLPPGSTYTIEVATEPPGQVCEVVNGAGTVGQDDVDDVVVACQLAAYSVGGTVSGFASGVLVLQNNGGDDLSVTGNGAFTFATGLASGSAYEVLVATQPDGRTCVVTSGSGTVGTSDITTVSVSCEASLYTVGGTLSGLSSGTVTLTNNGGDNLELTANGEFTFATAQPDGTGYNVAVAVQPAGQFCAATNESGTTSGSNVANVAVACSAAYSVGGTVDGWSGGALVLQNNGADDLTISGNGTFTFPTLIPDGSAYDISVSEQPANRTCVTIGGVGTVAGANVTDVQVSCSADALTNRIVFHSDRDGDFEIFAMDPNGSNLVQLTNNSVDDLWPVVSPDGTRIAYWTGLDGNQEIYAMDADGSNLTRVTNNGAADRQPAWSPDGQRIAFYRATNGTSEIYTIKVDGTGLVRLTNNAFDDQEPAWSPDGSTIAFTTNRDGNDEIYLMSAGDGSNQRNISNNAGRDGRPDWSPNGNRILFDRNNSSVDAAWLGDSEIMCMNADGSGQVRLTTDTVGAIDAQPRWSANGSRLAFNSDRVATGVNPEIYVGRANNCSGITQLDRVTNNSAKDAAADWAPQ